MRLEELRLLQEDEVEAAMERVIPCEKNTPQGQPHMEQRLAALRKAVVWSEVLGEPAYRKRKRKAYGNQGNIGRGRGGNTETA